jgi:DNA mismatch repair protein MutS2
LDEKALSDLEFGAILERLAAECATPLGARAALSLRPARDADSVAAEQETVLEARAHLETRGTLPFGTLTDVTPGLDRLAIEGNEAGTGEILEILALMRSGRDLRGALAPWRDASRRLWSIASEFPDLGNLLRFLDGKIGPKGEILDHASDTLAALRADLRRAGARLEALLQEILRRPEVARALMDDFVALRSERHVIPIRAESRQAVSGIVHAMSGSGATVFLEPFETVEINNELVTLHEREAAEVRRLLREYSGLLRGRLPEIVLLARLVGRLDRAFASARLARRWNAVAAATDPGGDVVLQGARHPLVEESLRSQGGTIVPLDVTLPASAAVLVISGPNTGGKTVALKTVGLMALMHQCGLLLPAKGARLPVFRSVFLDIGDRQSIADRLSTFSARVRDIAHMSEVLEPPALLLLDEIGTGTDPEEGAALAIAIVDHFRKRGARVLLTTHLETLKAYAATTDGCANAAMQFDEGSGEPTYRLAQGVPGRSSALEIAARIGLPASILEEARRRRGASGTLLNAYLQKVEALGADLEARVRRLADSEARVAAERSAFEAEAREREARLKRRAEEEVDRAVAAARAEGERYLAGLRDAEIALRLRRDEEQRAARLREDARRALQEITGQAAPAPRAAEVASGTRVRVRGLGLTGVVVSEQGDRLVLDVRGKRMVVPRSDVESEGPVPAAGPSLPRGVTLERRPEPVEGSRSGTIDLRGNLVEDALPRLDKFLDDASLQGLDQVRLLHGVGSGRLRRAVRDHVARHPQVRAFENAAEDQGGEGATIVSLR